MKYVQSNLKDTRANSMSLWLTVNMFKPFSNDSVVDFEHLFVCWESTDMIFC